MIRPEIAIRFNPSKNGFDLYAHKPAGIDKQLVGSPVEFTEMEKHRYVPEPTMELDKEAVQELMNDLWRQGFRPDNQSEEVGELRATKRHLADFAKIISKQLEVDLDG